jgi:RNA polymerase sigma factor (sigma-70 family)
MKGGGKAMTLDVEGFAQDRAKSALSLTYLLTGSQADAEGLAPETWYRVHGNWPRVIKADHPDAYTRRILLNLFHVRSRRRKLHTVPYDCVARAQVSSYTALDLVAERDRLRGALAALPARQRAVVTLKLFEDLETNEIASAMGIAESSVRSALTRAPHTLRCALEGNREETHHAAI